MRPTVENRTVDFSVNRFQRIYCPDHLHSQMEILMVLEGETELRINGEDRLVRSGEAAVLFPNQLHGYYDPRLNDGVILIFDAALLPELAVNWENAVPGNPVVPLDEDGLYCLRRLYAICMDEEEPKERCRALTRLLMTAMLPALRPETASKTPVQEPLYLALEYISAHSAEPITLQQTARHVGVNSYYLSHLMNDRLRMGFREYLNALRVERAQELLRSTGKSVEEIGEACGFGTLRTFDRAFQRQCGVTPRQYRQGRGGREND